MLQNNQPSDILSKPRHKTVSNANNMFTILYMLYSDKKLLYVLYTGYRYPV